MEARVPIRNRAGGSIGVLVLAQLPRSGNSPVLVDSVGQVVEGGVYRYQVLLDERPAAVVLDPGDELFSFDSHDRLTGRFQPRQHVGRVRIAVTVPASDTAGIATI